MTKSSTVFSCQNCGAQSPKWMGRCPECGQWNTYIEEAASEDIKPARSSMAPAANFTPTPLPEISSDKSAHRPVGIGELDRVLGGGLVPGSVTLIGGDPGIGKSTIVMQALGSITSASKVSNQQGRKVLYISGEESAPQIKLRAERLGVDQQEIFVLTENCLERLLEEIKKLKPSIIAVDSIQTIYSNNITSAPGTVSQVRESAGQLLYYSKASGTSTMLVGHVTKDGAIAGPKVLEHMVDTVLYFEGERGHPFRLLRAVKNRFGSTNEIGVFEMTGKGLKEVLNPSSLFLAERPEGAAGSVVVASLEGSRPVLVEIQALVTSSGFAQPRRTAIGMDSGRVALLVAVLEKIVGLHLNDQDIFLNVAGGLKVNEPAVDLGIITSITSSFKNKPIDPHTLILGEVGLTGEVRAVSGIEMRLSEASKMGFKRVLMPRSNTKVKPPKGMEAIGVATVEECLSFI
ncbi:MAG: DNA repair protein RadA [Deltaproteobacteria bacterium CG11_big_fil_rev_8_21_14_0_20_49_13]|nr:MAG: DNA repair protein RadA [Deltaproteobacteria bacterium CG11_big_fil_rev_8_21_14_0_20_49_13]